MTEKSYLEGTMRTSNIFILPFLLTSAEKSFSADVEFESIVPVICEIEVQPPPPLSDSIILPSIGKSKVSPAIINVKSNSNNEKKISVSNIRVISGSVETYSGSGLFSNPVTQQMLLWNVKEVDQDTIPSPLDFNNSHQLYGKSNNMSQGKKFAIAPLIIGTPKSGTIKISATITAHC
jgi:hypothetical protein